MRIAIFILLISATALAKQTPWPKFPTGCGDMLASILMSDDDVVRLAAADMARDNDDAAGWFLQRDVEASRLRNAEPTSRDAAAAWAEAEALRAQRQTRFLTRPQVSADRGLAYGLSVSPVQFLSGAVERLWRRAPTLRQLAVSPARVPAVAAEILARVSRTDLPIEDLNLTYFAFNSTQANALAASPVAERLTALRFSSSEWFPPDRYMDLGDPTPFVWNRLFLAPSKLNRLRLLDVRTKWNALAALAMRGNRTVFANTLEELHVGTAVQNIRGAEQVAAVLGHFPRLSRLQWFFPPVNATLQPFAEARGANQLKSLQLTFDGGPSTAHLSQVFSPTSNLRSLSTVQLSGGEAVGYARDTFRTATPFASVLRELDLSLELPTQAFADLFHDDSPYRGIRKLVIRSSRFTSTNLRQLFRWAGAESLEELELHGTAIDDSAFAELRYAGVRLRNLRVLRINNLLRYESSPTPGFGARCRLRSVLDTLARWPGARELHTLELSGFQPNLNDDELEPLRRPDSHLSRLLVLDLSRNRDAHFDTRKPENPPSDVRWRLLNLPELHVLGVQGLGISRARLFALLRNRVVFPALKMIRGDGEALLTRRRLEE